MVESKYFLYRKINFVLLNSFYAISYFWKGFSDLLWFEHNIISKIAFKICKIKAKKQSFDVVKLPPNSLGFQTKIAPGRGSGSFNPPVPPPKWGRGPALGHPGLETLEGSIPISQRKIISSTLTVNLPKMLLMLNNVFTLPRNYRSMDGLRSAASDYISQKLGNLGLLVGIQFFFPSRFYNQVKVQNVGENCARHKTISQN